MIEYILPSITDTEDYLSALSLFRASTPLTVEEAEKMLSLYVKYSEQAGDREFARLCLAVDLLPGRTREDAAVFAPLELGAENLDALFAACELVSCFGALEAGQVERIMSLVQSETVELGEKVLLTRTALDVLSGVQNFAAYREQAAALAEFLTGLGSETLDKYTVLVREVRRKCRN